MYWCLHLLVLVCIGACIDWLLHVLVLACVGVWMYWCFHLPSSLFLALWSRKLCKSETSFVRELSNIVEFECMWLLISDLAALWGLWRFWAFDFDCVRPRWDLFRYLLSVGPTWAKRNPNRRPKIIMDPHTDAKSEISVHIDSNSTMLLNSRTNKCVTFTELPWSTSMHSFHYIHKPNRHHTHLCDVWECMQCDVLESIQERASCTYINTQSCTIIVGSSKSKQRWYTHAQMVRGSRGIPRDARPQNCATW